MSRLLGLPLELLQQIISDFIDASGLKYALFVRATCTTFRNLILEEIFRRRRAEIQKPESHDLPVTTYDPCTFIVSWKVLLKDYLLYLNENGPLVYPFGFIEFAAEELLRIDPPVNNYAGTKKRYIADIAIFSACFAIDERYLCWVWPFERPSDSASRLEPADGLRAAAAVGSIVALNHYIKEGGLHILEPWAKSWNRYSAAELTEELLTVAAITGKVEVVQLLLENAHLGESQTVSKAVGPRVISACIQNSRHDILDLVLPFWNRSLEVLQLKLALEVGNVDMALKLFEYSRDIRALETFLDFALSACQNGQEEVVRYLLDRQLLTARSIIGFSVAASADEHWLLESKQPIETRTSEHFAQYGDPLRLAVKSGSCKTVKLLLDVGASIATSEDLHLDVTVDRWKLHTLITTGNIQMIDLLVQHGLRIPGTHLQHTMYHSADPRFDLGPRDEIFTLPTFLHVYEIYKRQNPDRGSWDLSPEYAKEADVWVAIAESKNNWRQMGYDATIYGEAFTNEGF